MDWKKLLCTARLRRPREKAGTYLDLDPFQHDLDRIIFSQPFRRLQAKTQVHPLSDNDHVRTRLTHSMEVSNVGSQLGYLVGKVIQGRHRLDKQCTEYRISLLVQAACLAHDIGHPPFGHAGEQAIRDWFIGNDNILTDLTLAEKQDLISFDGNAQGFRILTEIENYRGDGGLQLTYATLGTSLKYPNSSDDANDKKFSFFQSEKKYIEEIASCLGLIQKRNNVWCRHPLAYLVEAADDICYAIIDLEDGVEMGSYRLDEYIDVLTPVETATPCYRR